MSTWSGIRNKLESDYLCPAQMCIRDRCQKWHEESKQHKIIDALEAIPAEEPVSYTHLDVYKRQFSFRPKPS